MRRFFWVVLFANMALGLSAQEYSNYDQQTTRVNALAKSYPSLVSVRSLVKTNGGKDIWLITIGTGKTEIKPAIAVIGGTEGSHLLGTEMAAGDRNLL